MKQLSEVFKDWSPSDSEEFECRERRRSSAAGADEPPVLTETRAGCHARPAYPNGRFFYIIEVMFTLAQIFYWLQIYKYFVLFPFTVFEGPIITIIAGYLASLGFLNIFIVYGVVILGDTAGDIMYYAAGKWGRLNFCQRWGHYFGATVEKVEVLEKYFERHAGKTLFWGKFGYGIVCALLFTAGVANVPFNRFLGYTFLATILKCAILLLIGFNFGYAYVKIQAYLDYTSYATIIFAVLLLLVYLFIQRFVKKFFERKDNNE